MNAKDSGPTKDGASLVKEFVAARRAGNDDVVRQLQRELDEKCVPLQFADKLLAAREHISKLLINSREAAHMMSVSTRKLWAMTFEDSPGLPYVRCGRLVRYSPDDLAAWIERQRTHGTSA